MPIERQPYHPTRDEWPVLYGMLCGYCDRQLNCDVVEAMIALKDGGPWPEGGWVTDPGAGATCLSYVPRQRPPMKREVERRLMRMDPPPVCGGCAARKGSEASVSEHTRRDFAACVENRVLFTCHESPGCASPCGGWLRAIARRA